MTTYRFAITGLRHHDFANRFDELYDKVWGSVCLRKSFFECQNQANLLTTYYHFLDNVYRQNNRTFSISREQNQCQSQALQLTVSENDFLRFKQQITVLENEVLYKHIRKGWHGFFNVTQKFYYPRTTRRTQRKIFVG